MQQLNAMCMQAAATPPHRSQRHSAAGQSQYKPPGIPTLSTRTQTAAHLQTAASITRTQSEQDTNRLAPRSNSCTRMSTPIAATPAQRHQRHSNADRL